MTFHCGFSNPQSKKLLDKTFKELSSSCVKTVRIFLFCDFRAGIHFDKKGYPFFDEKVHADTYILMESARRYKLELIPVLMDFHVADRWLFNYFDPFDYPQVLKDKNIRKELIKLFCEYIKYYSQTFSDVIQAWDLFNEPEWARAISLRTSVPDNDPRALYIKEMYSAAKENSSNIPVTVGWNKKENAIRFKDFSDIIQAHCYKEDFSSFLDYLSHGSNGKQIIAGEVGAGNLIHMEEILEIAGKKNVEIIFRDSPVYTFDNSLFQKYIISYKEEKFNLSEIYSPVMVTAKR
jgi:arabinogalactan endo-1,4-beta-galactosidase